eukprot:TRINITY_DN84636_c0_g1_i1.p1 TRINITY_DN84636_c0_g1~~TRINITY_DN84636_c0_g1_i1.p1  ORF type:complete len:377 (+),score=73.33 TRINITY_DN84636_c0_g1_i1:30-1133(+)
MRSLAAPTLVALCVLSIVALSRGDYYEDLELPKGEDSTDSDIKKAYRTLSKKWHPDWNPAPDARDKFQKISKAYDVLSTPKKRKIYDMKGDEGLKQLEEAEKAGQNGMMDPFSMLFGGGQSRTKGQNVQMSLKVALDDIYNGKEHQVTLQKQKLCRKCKGSGAASKDAVKECPRCRGRGVVTQQVQLAPGFVQQMQSHCDACGGTGRKITKKCPVCSGNRVTRGESVIEVLIEKGIPEGHEMVFEMEADESPDILPGDVVFKIESQPHRLFKRVGDDLHMTMRITLLESLVGFRKHFQHMDGRTVEVKSTGVTPHGSKQVLQEEGMPRHNVPSEKGKLVVTFEVQFPKTVTADQVSKFREILGDVTY